MAGKILIADDSRAVQKKASGVLSGEGLEVVAVSSGAAAIKKLSTVQPKVILADIAMPGMDGYEVCKFVKSSKEYANVPVILVYSNDDILDEQKGERVRADARIRKPFDRDELISTVAKYLAIAEAAVAKTEPPPVVKAPPASAFVSEPMDEERLIAPRETAPDYSSLGGGMVRIPFTLRINAEERTSLEILSKVEGRPINQILNEAIKIYLRRRGRKERSLEARLAALRAYRKQDPEFKRAVAKFVEAEATIEDPLGGEPIEGEFVEGQFKPAGPVQSKIRELLGA